MNSPVTSVGQNSTQQLVFPPDPDRIRVLAVDPPYPVGFKKQIDSAQGININMVRGDRDGLLAYILAYWNMAVGDYIKVFIATKNAPVAEFSVTDAHFDDQGQAKNIPFHISVDDMESKFFPLQPKNENFWFEVKRVSGNSEESPPVPLFYKYPAPGEPDTDGGKSFNQGLKLPIASETVVDQTVINDGMFVTVLAYFNQSIGDVVVLAFGSLLLELTVTALGDVVFELTPEMLATLKPTNTLIIRWEVFDVVENSSGWSDALILTFKPGIILLVAPIFELADPDNVVHHDWLAGGAMNVLVTGVFAINDLIELTLEGLTKGGDPVSHTYSRTLTVASRTLNFPVENEWVRNLIGGSSRAFYKLIRAGKTQLSKPADITITGTSQPLGLPVVEPLENDTVPVDTVMAKVTFPKYWPLKPGAKAELRWQVIDTDGIKLLFIFQQIITDTILPIIFQVAAKYIALYPSGPLAVQCSITNPGEAEVVSDVLPLKIGDEKAIVLTPPTLVGAAGPIDPLGAERTMQAEFLAAITGDRARLVRTDAPPNSPTFPITSFDQNKRATWGLDRKFLIANHGKTVQKHWNLRRNDKRIASSPTTSVTIAPIAPQDRRFPTPYISGVSGVLEVKKLTAANQLKVAPWPGQAPGQAKYLRFQGTNKSGATVSYQALNGELTGTEQGSTTALSLAWLIELKDETNLYIYWSVSLGPGQAPLLFPLQTYQVESLVDLQPFITALRDPQGREVPQSSETVATTITVYGRGSVNEQIQILVNGVAVATVRTDANGNFVQAVTAAAYDAWNTIQLRALYGKNHSSPARSYILRRPLQMATHQMNLHGYRVYTGWPTTGRDFPGNTETRTAFYGVGTRRFSSSNAAVASVDANGKVTGLRNGGAWIYVQDQFTTLTFYVSVLNVFIMASAGVAMPFPSAAAWMAAVPGSISLYHAWAAMEHVYGPHQYWNLGNSVNWMCTGEGCPPGYGAIYHHGSGNGAGIVCDPALHVHWNAWCLRPY